MISQQKGKNLRKGRRSLVNQIYHVTITCKDRDNHFSDFSNARYFIQQIKQAEMDGFAKTFCFVVMPDHVHWLVKINKISLQQLVQRVKSLTTKSIGFPIWQKGFYDQGIRSDESLISVARYIVANPLRAGLVGNVADYPHWDSIWL